ncbi:MAG: hypothetical protein HRU33_22280 [Rhodobacteraceae bacterium]|nr:hypothetical protein [Paracoccaceae bacterium]
MASRTYPLGSIDLLSQLFPPADLANPDVGLTDLASVIAHYTHNSLEADGFSNFSVQVDTFDGQYVVTVNCDEAQDHLNQFALQHQRIFSEDGAGRSIAGRNLMQELGVWNPMQGFPVNSSPDDGDCKWLLCPPLGLNVIGQRGILLMHYPPWQVLQQGTFLDCMTMSRWSKVLSASGVPEDEVGYYRTIVDVNPIAAPGSGQSEYPNDYFPIMMTSAFFDGPDERNYIRTMLDLYLGSVNAADSKFTLPLLVCGSPLYDPQAPGWFRTAFKDQLPVDANGTPTVDVLQTGKIRLSPDSDRETPYMVANHMIAAGVTGKCTNDASKMPDIRKYEAQDLVAASFLYEYSQNPDIEPDEAKTRACQRWFGADNGLSAPNPPDPRDKQVICALAQMDLFYCAGPPPHPKYTFDEAMQRCAGADDQPCCPAIGPTDPNKIG